MVYYWVMAKRKGKPRRPYGENYCRAIRVRLPQEVDSALRTYRRLFKVPLAHMVRAGVMRALEDAIPKAVAAVRDPDTSDAVRIKLLDFLRTCSRGHLAMNHPDLAAMHREVRVESLRANTLSARA